MEEKSFITIDWAMLSDISYQSNLGKSLKNTLRKFDKETLFDELYDVIEHFTMVATEDRVKHENRVKSIQSCNIKYDKYYPSTPVEKTFNDILGIRIIVDNYDIVNKIDFPESQVRIVDLTQGKSKDDGYRAIHVYYQKDHNHYPIEIQFMTPSDRQFNSWLHIYLYKYVDDVSVGRHLRELYSGGKISNEAEFRKEVHNVLSIGKKI